MKEIPGFNESPYLKATCALLERNYRSALQELEKINSDESFALNNWLYGFSVGPATLNALVWFELKDKKNWLIESERATTHLKSIVETNPLASPVSWVNLAICYALQGNPQSMKSTITKVRELTGTEYWKYRRQVECEMHIAIAYLVLGEHEKAIETLEAASKMDGPIFLNRELDLWFIFDRLKGNPRFDALLKD